MRNANEVGKTPNSDFPARPQSRRRRWKKGLFAVLTTGAFFALLELILTACGVRPISYHSDPYVGFSSYSPLFVPDSEMGATEMVTARNKLEWFNDQRFPKKKPVGAYRVFCLGGSTTYGRPYNDATSFSGWLREFLPAADGTREWEVINAGGISYASYRVAKLMEELARYEPDLFIIDCGHNEFLERRTYSSIIETPESLRNASALLSRSRTYTLLRRLLHRDGTRPAARKEGDSSKPFELSAEVKAVLDDAVGPDAYSRDDEQQRQVIAHFRFNLYRMLDIARSAGAQVVLVVPAGNLRACSPFKSQHRDGLGELELARVEELYAAAKSLRDDRPSEALELTNAALAVDDRYAHLHYLRGELLWRLKRPAEAKAAFIRARDEDVCPLRALSEMTDVVRDVAKQTGTPLVDFEKVIASKSDRAVPGDDWFLDHVHPTIAGHRLLGKRLLTTLATAGVLPAGSELSEAKEREIIARVEGRIDRRAHAEALKNLSKVLGWAGKQEDAHRLALRAVALIPDDPEAQYQAGNAYIHLREFEKAIERFTASLIIRPGSAKAYYGIGLAYELQRQPATAIEQFRTAVMHDPNFANAHFKLGRLYAAGNQPRLAESHFRRALQINPDGHLSRNGLGILFAERGDLSAAEREFRRAVQSRPGFSDALANLGRIERQRGHDRRAVELFRQALRGDRNQFSAAYQLAELLAASRDNDVRDGKTASSGRTRSGRAVRTSFGNRGSQLAHSFDHPVSIRPWAAQTPTSVERIFGTTTGARRGRSPFFPFLNKSRFTIAITQASDCDWEKNTEIPKISGIGSPMMAGLFSNFN
jgi:tetratricopeptide (TPR) repeat protein